MKTFNVHFVGDDVVSLEADKFELSDDGNFLFFMVGAQRVAVFNTSHLIGAYDEENAVIPDDEDDEDDEKSF